MNFEETNFAGKKVLTWHSGYAVIDNDILWIPAIFSPLGVTLEALYKKTGLRRIKFSAVLNPQKLKLHLRNVVAETDEYSEQHKAYSHCIEILYEPKEVLE